MGRKKHFFLPPAMYLSFPLSTAEKSPFPFVSVCRDHPLFSLREVPSPFHSPAVFFPPAKYSLPPFIGGIPLLWFSTREIPPLFSPLFLELPTPARHFRRGAGNPQYWSFSHARGGLCNLLVTTDFFPLCTPAGTAFRLCFLEKRALPPSPPSDFTAFPSGTRITLP